MESTNEMSSNGLVKNVLSSGLTKGILSTFVGKKMIELLQSGTNRLADEIVQAFKNKISDYLEIEYERNSRTKTILHRHEPIELDKFYQPLYLKKVIDSWKKELYSFDSDRISTNNIEELLSTSGCITIIGTAGSGKSTLVKYLFVNSIKTDYKIPIKIELRYLNDYNEDLLTYIKEEIVKFSEIAKSDEVFDRMMSAGAFVVFFDGYDEVSSANKENITKDICKITKKYCHNSYILTSRPFVNIDMLESFVNYQVCDLSDEEIESFVKKQFPSSEHKLADRIIQTINKDESSNAYRSFLSNPLLLSMFIITYQTDSDIPQKRSDYYNQVFNTLYSAHDTSSKLGYSREKKSGLSKEGFVEILKRFSFKSYFQQKYSFSLDYFENQLNKLKKDLNKTFKNSDFIYDTEVAIGILTQDGIEITFPHRSLQEYFAALYVTTVSISNKKKIYEYLYKQFNSCVSERYGFDDAFNFFSLLNEMDNISFRSQLILPTLRQLKERNEGLIKENVGKLKEKSEIIDVFISLRTISRFVSNSMSDVFSDEHDKYNKKYHDYTEKLRGALKKKRRGLLKGKNKKEEYGVYVKAREELAMNDIMPFLKKFNLDELIVGIEKDIAEAENVDAEFIDSINE